MKYENVITVVTPTYNRAHTLSNSYDTLKKQTNKSFVWLIVDDGSTDNTETIVKEWINEGKICVRYYKKENGGKASALNCALKRIDTEYWVCLDSDDIFSNNAIELALKELDEIKYDSNYCGVIALSNTLNGEVFGNKRIPEEVKSVTFIELSEKHKINSEYTEFYKTEITSKYRFPEIPGEKFIAPSYLCYKVNKKYKFKVSQESYTYCEYLPDGLTQNKKKVIIQNPRGYTLIMKLSFEAANRFIPKSIRCLKYISGSLLSKDNKFIKNSPHKLMTVLYYPFGWLVYKVRFR